MSKLLIISHTEHYKNTNGKIVGWGSTVTEINYLTEIFDEIIHIAPFFKDKAPKSSVAYNSKISFIPLKPSGGKFFGKFTILSNAPYNLWQIHKAHKKVAIIQFRAPTGIGLYVLPYLRFINRKPYWVKYAGNWMGERLPLGNRFQKWWLQNMLETTTKVTLNGNWDGVGVNKLAFENPCLSKEDRELGLQIVNSKSIDNNYNYCFVGGLNENKGIKELVEVFKNLQHSKLGSLHIVGDGALRKELEKEALTSKNKIIFYGYLPKNKIVEIYKKCNYIVLPSKSEGFPKVIGEGMNYGCIPIVSDISCIGQYVQNNYNGYLIHPLTKDKLSSALLESLYSLSVDSKEYMEINYKLAQKFTYQYYLNRIQKEIVG